MYITWGLVSKWSWEEWCKLQRSRKCIFLYFWQNLTNHLIVLSNNVIESLGMAKHPHAMLPDWISPLFWSFFVNLSHLTYPSFELCLILHAICESLKNWIFQHVPTYPGIFSVKWPSIPMFYTCKKTFLSGLSAHQIWAWYLKACQKKVWCQNYCGLWDTL